MVKKKKPKKPVRRRRRSIRFAGLGDVDSSAATRESTFAEKARAKSKEMYDSLRAPEPDCELALSRLLDTVSYAGMAEATAVALGNDTKKHTTRAVEALASFRAACPMPQRSRR